MKYASVYHRARSPYWWIAYLDPVSGKRKAKATVWRLDAPRGRQEAHNEAQQFSKMAIASAPAVPAEAWARWVPEWLSFQYRASPKTLQRYLNAWKHVEKFLREAEVGAPRSLKHGHVMQYMQWREAQKRNRGTLINHNTAVGEMKTLSIIQREAVCRGIAEHNPVSQARLHRVNVKEKPEISSAELVKIRKKLAAEPAWMSDCFEIAIHQGCRLSETGAPMRDVDLAARRITFHGKGGKIFTTALHHAVASIAQRRKREGADRLVELPKMAAKQWHFFFKRIELPHLCFHCTRVTAVTQLARAGISQQQAMRYIGHASATVHRVYTRLGVPDLSAAVAAMDALSAAPI